MFQAALEFGFGLSAIILLVGLSGTGVYAAIRYINTLVRSGRL